MTDANKAPVPQVPVVRVTVPLEVQGNEPHHRSQEDEQNLGAPESMQRGSRTVKYTELTIQMYWQNTWNHRWNFKDAGIIKLDYLFAWCFQFDQEYVGDVKTVGG